MAVGENRVKFYPSNDLATVYYLRKVGKKLDSFKEESSFDNINTVIEFYNICKYIKDGQALKTWSDTQYSYYVDVCKKVTSKIAEFFCAITKSDILSIYKDVDINYIDDFWILFSLYCNEIQFINDTFIKFVESRNNTMRYVLQNKKCVERFSDNILNYMLTHEESANLLIEKYLVKEGTDYYFPKKLTIKEKSQILEKYIDSENPSIDYLKLLSEATSSSELQVSDFLKYKAKKAYEKQYQVLFKDANFIENTCLVGFKKIDSICQWNFSNGKTELFYDIDWLQNYLDYPTILNNFIYVFDFFDYEKNCNYVFHQYQLGILEDIMGVKGKKEYNNTYIFNFMDTVYNITMNLYYKFLLEKNIELEDIFKWFFEEYIKKEFGIEGFSYNASTKNSSLLEKIKNLLSEMESVLKQFELYALHGEVNRELLNISSQHVKVNSIPSINNRKYLYSNSSSLDNEIFELFSNQSTLCYTEKFQSKYNCFYDLLINEKVKIDDFVEYQKERIKRLIDKKDVMVTQDGYLEVSTPRACILSYLYYKNVFNYYYHKNLSSIIGELETNKEVIFESTLFSHSEASYINFVLNKAEFTNGYDLRNRYMHGTYTLNEDEQWRDYIELLRIMVLIIVKINDEFCLKLNNGRNKIVLV